MTIHPSNQRYRDRILSAPYEVCIERARYFTESYQRTEHLHPSLRAAWALVHTMRQMTVTLSGDELIAGNRTSKLLGVILPVERGDVNSILEMDLDSLCQHERQPFHIDPDDRRELENVILPYWRGRTVRDRKKELYAKNGLGFRPSLNPLSFRRRWKSLDLRCLKEGASAPGVDLRYIIRGLRELLHNNPAFVMNVFDVQGHLIPGYKTVLREGFSGIRERSEKRLDRCRRNGDREGSAFLEAVMISCDAMRIFAERQADHAERVAAEEGDPKRRDELLEIAARCRRVPFYPPRNFAEAVQCLWLTQAGALTAYGMAAIFAVGRMDQYLYPYYRQDLETGAISREKALRLMEELLIKLGSNLMILPYAGQKTANELGSDSCAPTVGGVDAVGHNAVNDLTYLILDAFENVKSLGNSFAIRLSEQNPPEFWERALSVFRTTSGPALFNDEIVISALEHTGMKIEDARDYGVIGCAEPTGDGNTFACTSGNDISFSAAVEMTLLNGRLRIMGNPVGPRTGDPRAFKTFDEFMTAFREQVRFQIDVVARAVNLKDEVYRNEFPCPIVSATISGCVENGRDMTAGGARYNFGSIGGRGFATAVDSLAAIRHAVFQEKTCSMKKMIRMLDADFKGMKEDRQRLLNQTPKYGLDDDRADSIAADLAAFFCAEVSGRQTTRGGPFRPGFFSCSTHVMEGLHRDASPGGKRAGEAANNGFSPSSGSEQNGVSAMLRSVAKIDHRRISNGCPVQIKLAPNMIETDEGLARLIGLIREYFQSGGMEIQPHVLSSKTQKNAQQNPYR